MEIDDENQTNCRILGDSAGSCRRYPPQIDAAMRSLSYGDDYETRLSQLCAHPDQLDFRFPIVMSWNWCGEFSEKIRNSAE